MSYLEHINVTVSDPQLTATLLMDLFGWHIRWEGAALAGRGYTVHVGNDNSYVALYSGSGEQVTPKGDASYATRGGLNHLGVVVDDLDAVEDKVKAHGFKTHSHGNYEPGKRFYFHDRDGVEIEVIAYDEAARKTIRAS